MLIVTTTHTEITTQTQLSVAGALLVPKIVRQWEFNCFSVQKVLLKILPQTVPKDFCLPSSMR